MASLVLKMSVSLDGYVASADGSGDWIAAGRSDLLAPGSLSESD
jgi:riboflavin biosynthesis pyrimidine reductase